LFHQRNNNIQYKGFQWPNCNKYSTATPTEEAVMNILQINSSARRDGVSSRLANHIVARLRAADPDATLTVRDLNATPHPVLDEAALGALFTPPSQRTPEQAARVALDDALIAELAAADVVVLGVPMYNFGAPGSRSATRRPAPRAS
jgi:FMN-dependent NADH-azoreductase